MVGGVKRTLNKNDRRGKYCIFMDEAGLYQLVFRSKLPTAKSFCDWVCAKVLGFNIILVLKPGFYKFVFRSKLETAKIFSKWVFILVNILFFKPFIIPTNKSIRYWSLINYHLIYQLHSIYKLLFIPLITSQSCSDFNKYFLVSSECNP